MRLIFQSPTAVHLALSRTNLETLLRFLDQGYTREAAAIQKAVRSDDRRFGLIVSVEEDAVHYAIQGQAGPGSAATR